MAPIPLGCGASGGSHGYFLVSCSDDDVFYVLNARHDTLFRVPGDGVTWNHLEDYFGQIGSHWLLGVGDHDVRLYLEWRTGRLVIGSAGEGDDPPPRDLDSPHLTQLPRQYVDSFGPFTLLQPGTSLFPSLVLRRPGRPPVRLDGCYPGGCTHASIGPRVAVWTRGDTVKAYLLATRRRLQWRFRSQLLYSEAPLLAEATANRIFFNVPVGLKVTDGSRVDEVRLPR